MNIWLTPSNQWSVNQLSTWWLNYPKMALCANDCMYMPLSGTYRTVLCAREDGRTSLPMDVGHADVRYTVIYSYRKAKQDQRYGNSKPPVLLNQSIICLSPVPVRRPNSPGQPRVGGRRRQGQAEWPRDIISTKHQALLFYGNNRQCLSAVHTFVRITSFKYHGPMEEPNSVLKLWTV